MIIKPKLYIPQVEKSNKRAVLIKLTNWDILSREEDGELQSAQQLVQMVLKRISVDEKTLDEQVLSAGARWMESGEKLVDSSHFS
jgi:hypothetical protein